MLFVGRRDVTFLGDISDNFTLSSRLALHNTNESLRNTFNICQ